MPETLTTLIAKTQTTLLDGGTLFNTATVTAAARQALSEFNMAAPIYQQALLDVVSGRKEYTLDAVDFTNLIEVQGVFLQGTDALNENNTPLAFDGFFENNVPAIRLRTAQASGHLIVNFSAPQTIDGLDSESTTTLPPFFIPLLLSGICYWTLQIRGVSRIEANNLNQDAPVDYKELKNVFRDTFTAGLRQASNRRPPVGEPSISAWRDKWHAFGT